MNFNKVFIAGNLTRDPELKYTPSGAAVCSFGVAINNKWTDKSGEKHESVTFVDCDAWSRTAEVISEHLSKGSPIFVEGRLQLDQWTDKDGQKRSKLKVVCERMQFVGSKREGGPDSGDYARPEHGQDTRPQEPERQYEPAGDANIPF